MREYPEVGELVVCTVKKIMRTHGAFVYLDEYEGLEGFIHISEVASGWVKYIRDYVREGQKVVCKVINVDRRKGRIDLSLKRVTESQKREKLQQWKNEIRARKLFEIVCEKVGLDKERAFKEIVPELIDTYGSLYGAFEEAAMDDRALEEDGFTGPWVEEFVKTAQENIVPPYVKIHGYVILTDPSPDGVEHIREALTSIEVEDEIQVQYVGAPRYRIIVKADNYKEAEEKLTGAARKAIEVITSYGGEGEYQRRLKS